MWCTKNVKNACGFGNGTSGSVYGFPEDGGSTNIITLNSASSFEMAGNTAGLGLQYNLVNDEPSPFAIGTISEYPNQKDLVNYRIFNDSAFEDNCLQIQIKTDGWYVIHACCVIGGLGGVSTQNTMFGMRKRINDVDEEILWGPPTAVINEPAGDGIALSLSHTGYLAADTYIRFVLVIRWLFGGVVQAVWVHVHTFR